MIIPPAQRIDERPRIRPAHPDELYLVEERRAENPPDERRSAPIESTLPLVAEHDGRAIAGVNLTMIQDHTALIHGLWIEPAWAATDLPLRMMIAILEEGRKLGCLKVDMDRSAMGLSVFAILLESRLLINRATTDEQADIDPRGMASCYLNLYKQVGSLLT